MTWVNHLLLGTIGDMELVLERPDGYNVPFLGRFVGKIRYSPLYSFLISDHISVLLCLEYTSNKLKVREPKHFKFNNSFLGLEDFDAPIRQI